MYEVNGFSFESEKEAKRAEKEAEGIKIIKAQTKMNEPEIVLKLYNTLLQKKYFKTQVGIAFLVELQDYLKNSPSIQQDEIWSIPVLDKAETIQKPVKTVISETDAYRRPFRIALFFSLVFAFIILGMFTISYYSKDNVNIINYENAIIDKYEKWEADLSQREQQLKDKEAEIQKD